VRRKYHTYPNMIDRKELLKLLEGHLASTGQSARAFGVLVAHDPMLVWNLRQGREPREATRLKILKAIGK
jgi:homoserine dehydrogenase